MRFAFGVLLLHIVDCFTQLSLNGKIKLQK